MQIWTVMQNWKPGGFPMSVWDTQELATIEKKRLEILYPGIEFWIDTNEINKSSIIDSGEYDAK